MIEGIEMWQGVHFLFSYSPIRNMNRTDFTFDPQILSSASATKDVVF